MFFNPFFILLSISTIISWYRFFPRSGSERTMAILLLQLMLVLMFFYSTSINLFGFMLLDTYSWKNRYYVDHGLIPAWMNASVFVIHVLAGLAVITFSLLMARYKNNARVWLMRIIPVVAFTQGVAFYWSYSRMHGIANTQNTLLLFIMISLLLHAAIYLFLDSARVMKYFKAF